MMVDGVSVCCCYRHFGGTHALKMDEKSIEEFIQFLSPNTPLRLKTVALENIVGLTATPEGQLFFCKHPALIGSTTKLILDEISEISKSALTSLINLSADDVLAEKLVDTNNNELIHNLMAIILRHVTHPHVDLSCKILNNLTTQLNCAHKIYEIFETKKYDFNQLISLFCDEKLKNDYHHLAGFFCNLSQLIEMRRKLMKTNNLFKRLIPYTIYIESDTRREGIVGMIRNCCFDSEVHEILLNDEFELVVYLLLPLTGPEEFDDDEMSLLPLELQYLGDGKQRDPNLNVRKMLLEALTQLCATKFGRKTLKDQNIYLILRELHKNEEIPSVKIACENVIQILINDEPSSEYENLKKIEIPDDLKVKFDKMDLQDLNNPEN